MTTGDNLAALNREVERLRDVGDFSGAMRLAETLLKLSETLPAPDKRQVGACLNLMGILCIEQGRNAEAEPYLKKALAITEELVGPEHPDYGAGLSNLAAMLRVFGRHAEAEEHARRALAILERASGADNANAASVLDELAGILADQRNSAEAEPLYKRALAIRVDKLGSDHRYVATSLNNLAELYRAQGRYADAEPLYRQALSIAEKALGANHPAVSSCMANLAEVYAAQGRFDDAEPLSKRALALTESLLGPNHPHVGASLNNLAELHRRQGRNAEAERHYRRAIAIAERSGNRGAVATYENNLGLLYDRQSRHSDAEPLFRRSLAFAEAAYGHNHVKVASSINNLAGFYLRNGQGAKAEPLLRQALSLYETEYGPDHPRVGITIGNLGMVYLQLGRTAEADELFKRADAVPGWHVVDVPILFATNRRPQLVGQRTSFGAQQETDIAKIGFGKATVRASTSEVMNRAERFAQAFAQRDMAVGRQSSVDSLAVHRVELDPHGELYLKTARDRLFRAVRFPNQAFVFVHGYNTSFEDSAVRTAMIAFELDFDSAAFLFTWPSHAQYLAYRSDRERARIAAPFLLQQLHRIGAQLPNVKLHIIAHSTGAEIALTALSKLAELPSDASRPRLGQLIFAHADIDPARLEREMPSLRKLNIGVTSYSSEKDWAMRISRAIRWMTKTRVGAGPVHIDGVDAIDLTGLSGGPLDVNHTVFADNSIAFGDMHRLMATGERPPDKRTSFLVPVKTDRGTHWIYRKSETSRP